MQITSMSSVQNINLRTFTGNKFQKKHYFRDFNQVTPVKMTFNEYIMKAQFLFQPSPVNHYSYLPPREIVEEIKQACFEHNRKDCIPYIWLTNNECAGSQFLHDLNERSLDIIPDLLEGIKQNSICKQEEYYDKMLSDINCIISKNENSLDGFIRQLETLKLSIKTELSNVKQMIQARKPNENQTALHYMGCLKIKI